MSVVETNPHPSWQLFKSVFSFLHRLKRPSVDTGIGENESRARRDFILEMMDAHPEAFQHEVDCQTMMGFYASRF